MKQGMHDGLANIFSCWTCGTKTLGDDCHNCSVTTYEPSKRYEFRTSWKNADGLYGAGSGYGSGDVIFYCYCEKCGKQHARLESYIPYPGPGFTGFTKCPECGNDGKIQEWECICLQYRHWKDPHEVWCPVFSDKDKKKWEEKLGTPLPAMPKFTNPANIDADKLSRRDSHVTDTKALLLSHKGITEIGGDMSKLNTPQRKSDFIPGTGVRIDQFRPEDVEKLFRFPVIPPMGFPLYDGSIIPAEAAEYAKKFFTEREFVDYTVPVREKPLKDMTVSEYAKSQARQVIAPKKQSYDDLYWRYVYTTTYEDADAAFKELEKYVSENGMSMEPSPHGTWVHTPDPKLLEKTQVAVDKAGVSKWSPFWVAQKVTFVSILVVLTIVNLILYVTGGIFH